MKSKGITEAQFLALLEKVLPATVKDPHLAAAIHEAVTREIRMLNRLASFEKFCEKGGLPDLKPETVTTLVQELAADFGDTNVAATPSEKGDSLAVEISLPDRTITSAVRVQPEVVEEEEVKTPFVPYVISLPEDPELVWVLARREDLAPDDAGRSLARIEEEFWATKGGQKLLRDRTDRSFAEFIHHVPAAMLLEAGLKRHYKEPESLQQLRRLAGEMIEALGGGRREEALAKPEKVKKVEEKPVAEAAEELPEGEADTPPWDT